MPEAEIGKIVEEKTLQNNEEKALLRSLAERKLLTRDQVKEVVDHRREDRSTSVEAILLERKMVNPDSILEAKAGIWNMPFIDLSNYEIDTEVLELIPAKVANEFKLFPLFRIDGTLLIAMANPRDVKAIDKATRVTNLEISPALASSEAVESAISKHYGTAQGGNGASIEFPSDEFQGILEVIESEKDEIDHSASIADLERLAEEAPVVKMANMVLIQAIMEGASDVHFNPEEEQLRVRFRVDGIMQDSFHLPKKLQDALISRIKILSQLDIAEHRIPQDGQMRIRLTDGRDVDIRVSTLPSAYGENVVLRILDKNAALLNLENLGFEPDVYEKITSLLSNSYGIVLVTGPTGSGKTTTLYAALNRLSSIERNVITLEDPIEYRLPLIRQSQVNHKAGMTFAKGLRAILRQDPDIVMVGEIRDTETATIAVQAALTGHLVLSTLHTNSAAGAITRLAEMDIEPFLISTAVLGVMAQRLVRRICSECKEEYKPNFELPKSMLETMDIKNPDRVKLYRGKGCKKCRNSGHRGRLSIVEVLPVTENIRNMILKNGSVDEIAHAAETEGMTTLLHDGWIKVMQGQTTIEEVMRVTNIG